MLDKMLAKMASKMRGAEEPNMKESDTSNGSMSIDPTDPDAKYKAGAVLAQFQPILQKKLEEKDPEKYKQFMDRYSAIRKEANDLMRKGDMTAYKKKEQEANELAENDEYNVYLTKDEIKSALGDGFDAYADAVKVNNVLYGQKKLAGGKEAGNVNGVEDILYGRRMATQKLSTGISKSTNGKSSAAKYYKYDPNTRSAVLDTESSFNYESL